MLGEWLQRRELRRLERARRDARCPDCGSALPRGSDPIYDRCHLPAVNGAVRGHGCAPRFPPRPAAVPPAGPYC